MPIVEYRIATHAVRFKDWLGRDVAGTINVDVPVLYNPGEPSVCDDRPENVELGSHRRTRIALAPFRREEADIWTNHKKAPH